MAEDSPHSRSLQPRSLQPRSLPVGEQPADVPSFGCIVYVQSKSSGGVIARVANLPGIAVEASSERDALSRIVPQFKQQVSKFLAAGEPVPWIDPPDAIEPGEQKRFLPVHL